MTRFDRLDSLILEAHAIFDDAIDMHTQGKTIVGTCVLFSGGNDSTVLAHLMRGRATHAVHANTTIGIEQTRQFVRDTCAAWGLPLIEKIAPVSYRQLVIERGFPGPSHHFKMYQRLKERALREARRELVSNGRSERVLFIAGRRREESRRRSDIPDHEREGSVVWVSPLANWTKLDLNTYRMLNDVPRNEVADVLHMSGECLCGAFAHAGELDEIRLWYPAVAEEIDAIAAEVRAAGHPDERCVWGWGAYRTGRRSRSGPLCSSCDGWELAA